MRRKQVSKRWKSIAEVRASVAAHRSRVGAMLDERAAVQTAEPFSYQPFFEHMDGELARVQLNLVTAEDDLVRQLVRGVRLRRETQQLTVDVYNKQVAARRILSGLYGGDSEFELAAVQGSTPEAAQTLAEQVDQTVKLLRDPEGAIPAALVAGVAVDFVVLASDLETAMAKLLASNEELQRTRKAIDGTRILKDAAIAEVNQVFPWVAGSLENCFRLAGERELADRIRTSVRVVTRRQKAKSTEPADSSPDESSPGDPTSGESASENEVPPESGVEQPVAAARASSAPAAG